MFKRVDEITVKQKKSNKSVMGTRFVLYERAYL